LNITNDTGAQQPAMLCALKITAEFLLNNKHKKLSAKKPCLQYFDAVS